MDIICTSERSNFSVFYGHNYYLKPVNSVKKSDIDKTLDGPSVSGISSLIPATCAIGASATDALLLKNVATTTLSTASTAEILTDGNMPAVARPTTTADISDEHKFSINARDIEDFDINDLPDTPKENNDNVTTTPTSDREENSTSTHNRRHPHYHDQGDVNSIESLNENDLKSLKDISNLDWIDDIYHNVNLSRNGTQKKKRSTQKDKDQLDGIMSKPPIVEQPSPDDDDKVVKCLYYTLMCCDCTIS